MSWHFPDPAFDDSERTQRRMSSLRLIPAKAIGRRSTPGPPTKNIGVPESPFDMPHFANPAALLGEAERLLAHLPNSPQALEDFEAIRFLCKLWAQEYPIDLGQARWSLDRLYKAMAEGISH